MLTVHSWGVHLSPPVYDDSDDDGANDEYRGPGFFRTLWLPKGHFPTRKQKSVGGVRIELCKLSR